MRMVGRLFLELELFHPIQLLIIHNVLLQMKSMSIYPFSIIFVIFRSAINRINMCKDTNPFYYPLSHEAVEAIDAIEYITQHLKKDEEYKMVSESGFMKKMWYLVSRWLEVRCNDYRSITVIRILRNYIWRNSWNIILCSSCIRK